MSSFNFETKSAKVAVVFSGSTEADGYLFNVENRETARTYVQSFGLQEIVESNIVLRGDPTAFNDLIEDEPSISFEQLGQVVLTWKLVMGKKTHTISLSIPEQQHEGQNAEVIELTRTNKLLIAKVDELSEEVRLVRSEMTLVRSEMKIHSSALRWSMLSILPRITNEPELLDSLADMGVNIADPDTISGREIYKITEDYIMSKYGYSSTETSFEFIKKMVEHGYDISKPWSPAKCTSCKKNHRISSDSLWPTILEGKYEGQYLRYNNIPIYNSCEMLLDNQWSTLCRYISGRNDHRGDYYLPKIEVASKLLDILSENADLLRKYGKAGSIYDWMLKRNSVKSEGFWVSMISYLGKYNQPKKITPAPSEKLLAANASGLKKMASPPEKKYTKEEYAMMIHAEKEA